ncbi:MAG: exonuclease SbcCD subunit D [Massiliimalia sp.]|jgi:exonuclease SbcD
MKIVHTSDWHIGKLLCDYSLLEDQAWFLDWFLEQIQKIRPDAVVICGDIYDRSVPSAEAVALLDQALNRLAKDLSIPVILTAGNHDSGQRLSFGSAFMESQGLYIGGMVKNPVQKITLTDAFGPVDFYLLPWFDQYTVRPLFCDERPQSAGEAFRLLRDSIGEQYDPCRRSVLLAHGFFAGASSRLEQDGKSVGGGDLIGLERMENMNYIALGHIHRAQNAGLPQAWYSGSPLKYSVDEQNQKKEFLVVDIPQSGPSSIEHCPVQSLRDLRCITGSFQQIMSRDFYENMNRDDYLMITLTDPEPVPDVMTRFKGVFPHVLGVQFPEFTSKLFGSEQTKNVLEQQSMEELFSQFYEQASGREMTDLQKKTVKRLCRKLEKGEPV